MIRERTLRTYFAVEKANALLLMLLALVGAVVGACLWFTAARQATAVLLALSILQFSVGATIYLRTDTQVKQLLNSLKQSPTKTLRAEQQRMARVQDRFVWYAAVTIAVIVIGIGLVVAGARAIGVALTVQALILLLLDRFAAKRAREYVGALSTRK